MPRAVMTLFHIIAVSNYTPKNSRSLVIIMLLNSRKDHVKHGGITFDFFSILLPRRLWIKLVKHKNQHSPFQHTNCKEKMCKGVNLDVKRKNILQVMN